MAEATTLKQAEVDSPCHAYIEMAEEWDLMRRLIKGSSAMRAAGETYLPQEDVEQSKHYNNRLARSFLLGFTENAIRKISSRPFRREVRIKGDLPKTIEPMADNVDREGHTLTQFANQMLYDGITYGKTHVLVDYPALDEETKKLSNLERMKNGILPYFIHFKPDQVIGWRSTRPKGTAEKKLIQVRIKSENWEPDGDYGEKKVEYVRVYTPGRWELHAKEEGQNKFIMTKSGETGLDYIPFYTFYTRQTGYMTAKPALSNLAETELTYWQSYSDHRNILRVARFALLFIKGVSHKNAKKFVAIGPFVLNALEGKDADMKFVEHHGHAIKAGERDLERLEKIANIQAMQPMVSKSGFPSATGEIIEEAKSQADIVLWVKALQKTIHECFKAAGNYVTAKLSDDFGIDIFDDVGITVRSIDEFKELTKLFLTDKMPADTFYAEAIRRGVIDDMLDPLLLSYALDEGVNLSDVRWEGDRIVLNTERAPKPTEKKKVPEEEEELVETT
jgi:hypothetical protein